MPTRRHVVTLTCAIAMASLALGFVLTGDAPPSGRSCATVVLRGTDGLLVAHNLDESIEVPGLIVFNPRGLRKENRTFEDLRTGTREGSAPRVWWDARYASLTYNVFGREFPDGGLNEAGLYVGEMTLLRTEWPKDTGRPRLYHHQWIQYLLDQFDSVGAAVLSLERVLPEGHCKWHFLLADRTGDVAVIEFLGGRPVVYRGKDLPFPVLCNDPYGPEVAEIAQFRGFGGTRAPEPRYEREDPRFRWAALMLRAPDARRTPEYAFAVLKRLDTGTTKWSLVYDVPRGRLSFRTPDAPRERWVDLASFPATCTTAPLALDIHRDAAGDVRALFAPLTPEAHRNAVAQAWAEIDAGFFGNRFFKPAMVRGLGNAPDAFRCAK